MTDSMGSPSPGALAGRRALVTGAASGIGAACARALAAAGASVIAADRDETGAAGLAEEIGGARAVRAGQGLRPTPARNQNWLGSSGTSAGETGCHSGR